MSLPRSRSRSVARTAVSVQSAIGRARREDQLAPFGRKERRRRPFDEHPGVRRTEQFHGGQHGIVRRVRLEPECFQEPRAEAAKDGVFLGRGDQDVLLGDVGRGLDHWQGTLEPGHADLTIDRAHAVLTGCLRLLEREDRAPEQQQRVGDVTLGCLEAPLVLAAGLGEQRAHVFFEHGERCVRKPGLKFDDLSHQDCDAAHGFKVRNVLRRHDSALVDQPAKTRGMDAPRSIGADPEAADEVEPVQQLDHVRWHQQLPDSRATRSARPA